MVLAIIALLATVVAPQVIRYLAKAKTDTATAQLRNIENAVELYYLDVGKYPPGEGGLGGLITAPAGVANWSGPYLKKAEALNDPWHKPYGYRHPGEHGTFDVFSLGRDGRDGGDGEDRDVTSW